MTIVPKATIEITADSIELHLVFVDSDQRFRFRRGDNNDGKGEGKWVLDGERTAIASMTEFAINETFALPLIALALSKERQRTVAKR